MEKGSMAFGLLESQREKTARGARRWSLVVILGMLCAIFAGTAHAQFDTGTITGLVSDPSGAVIPQATVTILNTGRGIQKTLQTDGSGNFTAPAMPFGKYVVTATAANFSKTSTPEVTLNVGATINLKLTLTVSTASETVEVTGTAQTINSSSSTSGMTLDSTQVGNLPVNGRDVSSFMNVVPGAVGSTGDFQGSVNGLDNVFTGLNIKLDGQSAGRGDVNGVLQTEGQEGARVTRASLDSVQEIDYAGSGYSAEGGFSLGPQMNIITKGGTNQFHGTLFEYLRNNALDARDYFDTGVGQPLRLNQFGGSLAGPIFRNKLFFFANYEGDRTHVTLIKPNYAVPSAYVRSQFVASMQPILALMAPLPANCSGTTGPGCHFDATSQESNGQYDRVFVGAALPSITREDTGSVRVDYHISDKDTLMGRYNINDSDTNYTYGIHQGQVSPQTLRTQLGKIDETHIFSPTLLNEFSIAVNRFHSDTASNTEQPYFAIAGFFTNLGSLPGAQGFNQTNANTLPELFDTVTMTAGPHSLKIGTQVRLNRLSTWLKTIETYGYGSFSDLENNNPFVLQKQGTPAFIGNNSSNWDIFAQDDWKVFHNFTLNIGVRYDYNTTWNVAHNRQRQFDYDTQSFGPIGESAYSAPRTDIAPRIGFSWDPYGKGKTVVHGYGGLFYMPMQPSPNTLAANLPENASISDNVFDAIFSNPPFSISYPTPNPPLLPGEQNVNIFPKNPRDPYSTNWLFGIQQELAANTILTVNYTGNRVQHTQAGVAYQGINLNPSNPNTNVNRPLAAMGIPYQNENYMPNNLNSNYHALQAQLMRNVGALNLTANYTWSHEIDNEVNVFAGWSDPFNINLDRGSGDWDTRNNFTASALYTFPELKASNLLMRETLGGWQTSNVIQARSGMAQNVEVTNGFFGNYMRPNLRRDVPLKVANAHWPDSSYNLSAFELEPGFNGVYGDPSTHGNFGRNLFTGPQFFQWDLSAVKSFPLTEKLKLQFRADIFNILNHPNFSNVDGGICSSVYYPDAHSAICKPNTPDPSSHSGFGLASATVAGANGSQIGNGTNRQTQLSLRLSF